MNRFRPNVVFGGKGGAPPFAEDGWGAVAVGLRGDLREGCAPRFAVTKPCARCKMPTIDQASRGAPSRSPAPAPAPSSTSSSSTAPAPVPAPT